MDVTLNMKFLEHCEPGELVRAHFGLKVEWGIVADRQQQKRVVVISGNNAPWYLAQNAGAGSKTWRAYLSSNAARPGGAVSARDRIGAGPWQNFKGVVVAQNVDDLHGDSNKLTMENSLTERGTIVSGTGMTPNWHDVLTGSAPDGRAFPANMNLTCNNWTSSTFGSAMVGHVDRNGTVITPFVKSWNAAHMSRSCSQPDLIATGGNGLFYCFAQ
jgi:hypothetical protein